MGQIDGLSVNHPQPRRQPAQEGQLHHPGQSLQLLRKGRHRDRIQKITHSAVYDRAAHRTAQVLLPDTAPHQPFPDQYHLKTQKNRLQDFASLLEERFGGQLHAFSGAEQGVQKDAD